MATTIENHVEADSEAVLSLCAGSSLAKGQIIFSPDSKYLFCCSGSVVKVFNTTNGQCAQQLRGHRDAVTGLAINPVNKLQLFSCGLDGVVNRWDYSDGVLLKSHSFYMPLYGYVSVDPSAKFVYAIARRPQASNCCVVHLSLRKSQKNTSSKGDNSQQTSSDSVKTDVLVPLCSADHRTVTQGCNDEYIASVHGHELSVHRCKKRTCRKFTAEKNNPFTCVACHPTEYCLATGHANGKITIWWDIFSKKNSVMSFNHWHSLSVQALAFTPEGSYLLSGGHECVLVKWQMNSENKDFLPRLGTPLHSITSSPDGTLYVTSHTDNVLQIITSNFHIEHAIRGLARAHLGIEDPSKPIPVGLLCDPRSKALVTNGRPGHLQFYCMNTDTQLFNLDIVGQNYVSPDNLKKPLVVTEVEQAAFDRSGNWLATFEHWDDGQMTPEYRIKFWSYNRKQQNYQLNTTVESPHTQVVGCLQFRPQSKSQSPHTPAMVSTGADGFFKLWILVSEAQINRTVERWTCDSVGYYRDRPAGMARFSEDGSVLAVAFQKTLTLWEPEDNVMKATLSLPTCNKHIKFVEFGGKSCSHFVVTTTDSHLTVWNLISLSVHLRVSLSVAVLTTDGDLMAAVTTDQDLFVFRPSKWEPIFKKEKAVENSVISAIFLPQTAANHSSATQNGGHLNWQKQSRLYLLDCKQQLFTPDYLGDVTSAQKDSSRSGVSLQQTLPQTPFSTILSSSRQGEDMSTISVGRAPGRQLPHGSSSASVLDVMNTAVPTMEPFHAICGQFIESLLIRNKGVGESMEQEEESEEEDEGDSMATDSS
ncbi:WD repeat-containing protein 75-like [Littorina saxatilis]|uniref:WD repeat-containing protein 75 second beta-propeller domain-containing protein n=1 Tax=Littorina saxatilis TaxID=31220 RepID=A0AAN9GIR8_9CAEN